MKSILCWKIKFFSVCIIILSILFIGGCADSSDDSNPFANDNYYDYSHPNDDNGNGNGNELVAYYPFNGNANDESGNGHNGIVNGATLTQDRFGNPNSAYHFNGSSSGIRCDVGSEMSLSKVTLAAWINLEGPGGENPRIVAVNQSGTSNGYYALIMSGTDNPRHLLFQEQSDLYSSSSKLFNNNGWHHVAVTYNGSNVTFYVDGVADPVSSANHSSLASFSNAVLNIGYSDNGLDRFNGDIDEIRIYNYALSASEILALYNQ